MPSKPRLTRTQRALVEELDNITSVAGLDYWNILDRDVDNEYRTTILQVIVREIVRGEVVTHYTLIDEHLGSRICNYLFDSKKFMALWKTKKFERFNYYILEKMSLLEKLALVKDIYRVSKTLSANIESINAIRNALTHAFFPENLRAHRSKHGSASRKLTGSHYKGIDIFTLHGFERFMDDARSVENFLALDIRRKRRATGR